MQAFTSAPNLRGHPEGRVFGDASRAPGERVGGLVGEGHAPLRVLGEPWGRENPEMHRPKGRWDRHFPHFIVPANRIRLG